MQMTNGEIVASYRQAKNKKEQVKILAELNACNVEEITKILVEGGVAPNQLPRNRENKAPEKSQPTYTAPVVEVTADTAPPPMHKESPSDIILQALQCYRADIEKRMAIEEEEHTARMSSYMKRLEQIDEIQGGMA